MAESSRAVIQQAPSCSQEHYQGIRRTMWSLYDEQGKIVGGTDARGNILAAQMIFAEVPERKLGRDQPTAERGSIT